VDVDCVHPVDCFDAKSAFSEERKFYTNSHHNSLHPMTENNWEENKIYGVCDPCVKADRDYYSRGRRKLWESLPELFNLPTWEELESSLASSLGDE